VYQAYLGNNLSEHELDHVFLGKFDGKPNVNPEEAKDFRWISFEALHAEIEANPEKFTYWFKFIIEHFSAKITPEYYESL